MAADNYAMQAVTQINVDLVLIGPLGKKYNEIWIKIQEFSFRKMNLKMMSAEWWTFCFNVCDVPCP